MTMGLLRMPIEIISLIIELLGLEDLFNLGLSCRHLCYILQDDGLCRLALKNAKFSAEYEEASATGAYAKGLRTIVKRRKAVRTARPFLACVVAMAHNFVFTNGALCYTVGRHSLRLVLLRGEVTEELEIDTQELFHTAVAKAQRELTVRCRPLYHNDDILSCVFTQSRNGVHTSWLVVLNTKLMRILSCRELESLAGLFVRNNGSYLYYGTRSEYSEDRYKRWAVRGLDLQTREWIPDRIVLWDLVGAEMGSTVCFEIFDDYLYGISSETVFEPAEDKWNSFYYCFRFQLGQHSMNQVLPRPASWRRQATEGPIDDRWSLLELSRDEQSGQLYVFESRKEFLPANTQSQRTCYRKKLVFPAPSSENMHGLEEAADSYESLSDPEGWASESHTEERADEDVHEGDKGSSGTAFNFNDSPVRSYNSVARSWVDLVNKPSSLSPREQRLMLRIRPQIPNPDPPVDKQGELVSPADSGLMRKSTKRDEEVVFWPPVQDPGVIDPLMEDVHAMLNAQGPIESALWATDERHIVYAPRFSDKGQTPAIFLISFDPSLHLHGLRTLRGGLDGSPYSEAGLSCSVTEKVEENLEHHTKSSLVSEISGLAMLSRSRCGQCAIAKGEVQGEWNATPMLKPTSENWARKSTPLYSTIMAGQRPYGFDMAL